MKAIDSIDRIFTLDTEIATDAGKAVSLASDEKFIQSLAEWAAKKSGENVNDTLTAVKEKYDSHQIATLKDILSVV